DGPGNPRDRLRGRRLDRLRARVHQMDRPLRLAAPDPPRLLLDALGQGAADVARQVRQRGRRTGLRLPDELRIDVCRPDARGARTADVGQLIRLEEPCEMSCAIAL